MERIAGIVLQLGLGLALVGGAGCRQRVYQPPVADAGPDGLGSDGPTLLALDIAVTGCADFNLAAVTCSGPAPLALSFSPVGSPELTSFLWTFGDGTAASTERAPSHTYTLPGTYDVSVTGAGSVGTISQDRRGLVIVQPLAAGAPCDIDQQCGDGLRCFCRPGTGCAPAFARGLCSTACETGFCGAGAACASYALGPSGGSDAGASADAGAGATSPVCLATCQTGADCAAGFACQQFPAGGAAASGWVHGCLPLGVANDVGASCRNASGALDDDICTTGHCADVGALGICSALCDQASRCPAGAACAELGDGSEVCLGACSSANPCPSDPGLGCRAPGSPADAGADAAGAAFQIIAGDAGASYCAPN